MAYELRISPVVSLNSLSLPFGCLPNCPARSFILFLCGFTKKMYESNAQWIVAIRHLFLWLWPRCCSEITNYWTASFIQTEMLRRLPLYCSSLMHPRGTPYADANGTISTNRFKCIQNSGGFRFEIFFLFLLNERDGERLTKLSIKNIVSKIF
jgi:hypothetical protein